MNRTETGVNKMRIIYRKLALALLLMLVLALLTACGGPRSATTPDDQTAVVDLSQVTLEEMTVQYVAADGKRTPTQTISDAFLLGLIDKELRPVRPATTAPQRAAETVLTLTLNDAKGKHVLDCPYVEMAPPEQAWLSVDGVWRDVPLRLKGLIRAVRSYNVLDGGVDSGDQEFLQRYGWTAAFPLSRLTVQLPEQFAYRVGGYPVAIYWAYNQELGKSIGLDLTPYLGQEVTVRIYKIVEELPEFMTPQRPWGRAVILRRGDKIIGAWLDAGRSGWACSLQGKSWETVTGRSFEAWVADLLQRDDSELTRLAALTPEEVVRAYYAAVDSHDAAASRLYRSIKSLWQDMFINMDNSLLFNSLEATEQGLGNIISAEVQKVERTQFTPGEGPPEGTVGLQVMVDLRFKQIISLGNGPQPLSFYLREEILGTGWRIISWGTGP